jgi:acetyl esterase/lipase
MIALKLDVYQPTGDTVTNRRAIIWAHGGGFTAGDKSSGPSPFMANFMAQRGYVTVSINYRLLPSGTCIGTNTTGNCVTATFDAIHDGQAAVRWLRANASTYHIDPDWIGIGGESAGAIIATGVGVWSDSPGDSGNPGFPSNVQGFMSLSGGLPNGLFVTPGDSPGLLFTGTADPIVPTQWSDQTADALNNVGSYAALEQFPGEGHVPFTQNLSQIEDQTVNFFYDTLNAKNAGR